MYYSYDNTRKTWNTNFISVCQKVCIREILKKTYFFWFTGLVFDLETIGSFLDYDLTADIWEKNDLNFGGKFEFSLLLPYYNCTTERARRSLLF